MTAERCGVLLATFVFFSSAVLLLAQGTYRSQISGVVADSSGAAAPKAGITTRV